MKFTRLMALTALTVVANSAVLAEQSGKDVYGKVCATCRGTFVAVKEGHPAYHRW